MDVAIHVRPSWARWSPLDVIDRGLGGSETAVVRVAEKIAARGHDVTVYADVQKMDVDGVRYRDHGRFSDRRHRDLVISLRDPAFFDRVRAAGTKALWMQDAHHGLELTTDRARELDAVMVLSRWHERFVLRAYPFLVGKTRLTRNAIIPDFFASMPIRHLHRAIYSSSFDRGLDLLIEWWPDVRERVPDAELVFCQSPAYELLTRDPAFESLSRRVKDLRAATEGVVNLGSLAQPRLAKEMQRSGAWLAPSWITRLDVAFHETFCIGAVEAAAAGCHRVMSRWGALAERDEAPATTWYRDGDRPVKEHWVEAIIAALLHDGGHEPSAAALSMTWDEVADDVLSVARESTAFV